MSSFAEIDRVLTDLGEAQCHADGLRRAGWSLVATLAALCLALVLSQIGYTAGGLGTLLLTISGGFLFWIWQGRVEKLRVAASIGDLTQRLVPELGTGPTSAIELARRLKSSRPFSRDLATLHIDNTADALVQIDLEERLSKSEARLRRTLLWAVCTSVILSLTFAMLLDDGRTRLVSYLLNPNAAQFSDVPLVGDIRITYNYPAYTGQEQRVVEGGDGTIAAVVGTEARIEATADFPVRSAVLVMTDPQGAILQEISMKKSGDRRLSGRVALLRDALYHFSLLDENGDRLEERRSRSIRATLDAYPEIHLDSPVRDIELKDDDAVDILWRAKDDYGVAEVFLVIEQPGQTGTVPNELSATDSDKQEGKRRIALGRSDKTDRRREGRYRWSVSEITMPAGTDLLFYLEAFDNDALAGPKRSVSIKRRLSLFSARRHHEELLAEQQAVLDALVDWLAAELTTTFPAEPDNNAIAAQRRLLERMSEIETRMGKLIGALHEDKLTAPEIAAAYSNLREHVTQARQTRSRAVLIAQRPTAATWAFKQVRSRQLEAVLQLEKDIIYLDDLLALQRIDELKETAKQLLASQRDLASLLEQYQKTGDPALRALLEKQIRELREKMMALLAKMAQIKQGLSGEYRNMEAASMLKVGDQLDQLEQMLRDGDLEGAAEELEQLANMLEKMVNSINSAEEKFGGERYAEMRKELAEFANEFRQLESQQKALSSRTDELLKKYRKEAIRRAGKNLEEFVKKARKKTGEALRELDEVARSQPDRRPLLPQLERELEATRNRLMDLDALLQSRDFSEARQIGRLAERNGQTLESLLNRQQKWDKGANLEQTKQSQRATKRAVEKTHEVNEMLDKLFPDPSEVLSPKQIAQMQRMAQKQRNVRQEADRLGERMDEIAEKIPLFGGEPRQSLDSASDEMGRAAGRIQAGELPGAAASERRAVDELGKLRKALEKASKGGKGGLPLPLGMGSQGGGQRGSGDNSREKVTIPEADARRADPKFRKELIEAAKQKAPDRYQEAVRRYYEELIR